MSPRLLRGALVVLVFASLGLIAWFLGRTVVERGARELVSDLPEMADGIEQRIRGFHRVNVRDGRKVWDLRAAQARVRKGQGMILVEDPELELFDPKGTRVFVRADEGVVELAEGQLGRVELDGAVAIDYGDYRVETPQGYYEGAEKTVILPEGVRITGGAVDLSGQRMVLNVEHRRVRVRGAVRTIIHDAPAGSAADRPEVAPVGFAIGDASGPITIDAERMFFDYEVSRILYRDDVRVEQGDFVLDCDDLAIGYDGEPQGGSAMVLTEVKARGNVRIREGARIATGDEAIFRQTDKSIRLIGNAILRDGPSEVKGDRLTLWLDEGRSVVESKPKSRVSVVLFPEELSGADSVAAESGAEKAEKADKADSGDGVAAGDAPVAVPGAAGGDDG